MQSEPPSPAMTIQQLSRKLALLEARVRELRRQLEEMRKTEHKKPQRVM